MMTILVSFSSVWCKLKKLYHPLFITFHKDDILKKANDVKIDEVD